MDEWLLFLGAGASVSSPASLPDFRLLAEGVLGALDWKSLNSEGPGPKQEWWAHKKGLYPKFESSSISAEVLFGTLHSFGVPFVGEVARVLGGPEHQPNAAHYVAASVLANNGLVWTPNVDLCVENALPDRANLLRAGRAGGRRGVPLVPLAMAGPGSLVKFHGTVDAPQTLAFTDRELLTPLPQKDVAHLAGLAKRRRVVLYGYAGADADLADLLDAVFDVASEVVWYEPTDSRRRDIKEAFPSARIEFAPARPPGGGLADTVPPTARAFLADAAAHGYVVPDTVEGTFAAVQRRVPPEIRLPAASGIVQARLVMRFGAPADEAEALRTARGQDLRKFRWRTVPGHLRWALSRSFYSGQAVAHVIRSAARLRPVLTIPGMRPVRDAIITLQCGLLLPRGQWQELADLTTWAIRHRHSASGKPYAGDLYYRANANRYLLNPGQAARDADAAVAGLASVLDPERLAGALLESGAAAIYQGRFDDALKRAFDLRKRRGRYAIARWQSWGGWLAAAASCHLGKPAEARKFLNEARPRFEAEQYRGALADLETMCLLADRVGIALGESLESHPFPPVTQYDVIRTTRQRDDLDLVIADLAIAHGEKEEARTRYKRVSQSPSCPVAAAWAELGLAETDRLAIDPADPAARDAARDAFAKVASLAREAGASWLEVQAVLGMALCGDEAIDTRWRELRERLPANLARPYVTDLAVGPPARPRVLWTVTI